MQYWYKTCPRCRQGRLFIMRLDESGRLYLHCEECEWAWDDPSLLENSEEATLGIDFMSEYATREQIEAGGWTDFALRQNE